MPTLELKHVVQEFGSAASARDAASVRAVDDVSLSIDSGTAVGLVGESGSGKSTLAKIAIRMIRPTSGSVLFEGRDLFSLTKAELKEYRDAVQIVFQDPYGSLNPRMRIVDIVAEPLCIRGVPRRRAMGRVPELLERVGFDPDMRYRRPGDFSGGQRQRIAIARSLSTQPRILLLDEPVSALDVSVQAQVLNVLTDLRDDLNIGYLFISHDLSVVRHMCATVHVLYRGRVVETGGADDIFQTPANRYTKRLLEAIPRIPRTTLGSDVDDAT